MLKGKKENQLAAVSHDELKPHHIDHALDIVDKKKGVHETDSIASMAIRHKNATPENIDKALSHPSREVKKYAVSHSNATEKNLRTAIKDADAVIVSRALKHKSVPKDEVEKHFFKPHSSDKEDFNNFLYHSSAAHNMDPKDPKVAKHSSARIDVQLDHTIQHHQPSAMQHPHATDKQLDAGIRHQNPLVGNQALKHPNLKMSHIQLAKSSNDSNLKHTDTVLHQKVETAVKEHKSQNTSVAELAKKYGVSATTIYSAMKD